MIKYSIPRKPKEFVIDNLMRSLFKEKGYFRRTDIVKAVNKHRIGKYSVNCYLKLLLGQGRLIRESYLNGKPGRSEHRYRFVEEPEVNFCSKCVDRQIGYHCSHCGKSVCSHIIKTYGFLMLCEECSSNRIPCSDCFRRTLFERGLIKQELDLLVPFKRDNKILWSCIRDGCESFGTEKTKEYANDLFKFEVSRLSEILESRHYKLEELEEEREYEQKRQKYLSNQATLLQKCDYQDSCMADECVLDCFEEDDYICPSGLPACDPGCYFCEECEYLIIYTDLDPRDREFQDYYCEFFQVVIPDESEEEIANEEENVKV